MSPRQHLRHEVAKALYNRRWPQAAVFSRGLPDRVASCLRDAESLLTAVEEIGATIAMPAAAEPEVLTEPAGSACYGCGAFPGDKHGADCTVNRAGPSGVPEVEQSTESSPVASSGKRPRRKMKASK